MSTSSKSLLHDLTGKPINQLYDPVDDVFIPFYSNRNATVLASESRTTTQVGTDIQNYRHRGISVTLDMTAVGTGSVTLTIEGKDTASGKYYTLLAGAAVTTNVTNTYKVYPGLTAVANAVANDVVPRTFRISVTANNANAATYSVGYSTLE